MQTQQEMIASAINQVGIQEIARECKVRYQSVLGWQDRGLPRTCYTNEKEYHLIIERLTDGQITAADLLAAPRIRDQH